MNKMKLAAVIFGLFSYSVSMQAQLLKGTVKADSISDMMITYYPDENILEAVSTDIERDAKGNFIYDGPIPSKEQDITIQADNDIFGVHLEKGKTAQITIFRNKEGKLEAKSAGTTQTSAVSTTLTPKDTT